MGCCGGCRVVVKSGRLVVKDGSLGVKGGGLASYRCKKH